MSGDRALQEQRAKILALRDLEIHRVPDEEIAAELGVSKRTLTRIRTLDVYKKAIEQALMPDDLLSDRIRLKIECLFQAALDQLEIALFRADNKLPDITNALKVLAQFRPQMVSQEPGTQLALPTQEFHPATVLIQNAYFGQQQGEVVEGEAKVLAPSDDVPKGVR